jgi:hypothetical protein
LALQVHRQDGAVGYCVLLDQRYQAGDHVVTADDLLAERDFKVDTPETCFKRNVTDILGGLGNAALAIIDPGFGMHCAIIGAPDAWVELAIDKESKAFLTHDNKKPGTGAHKKKKNPLRDVARRDHYHDAIVAAVTQRLSGADRVVVVLGRNYLVGHKWLAWRLINTPGVLLLLLEETGSSKTCSVHLDLLRSIYAHSRKFVCDAARRKLMGLLKDTKDNDDDDDDEEQKEKQNVAKIEPFPFTCDQLCQKKDEHHMCRPCNDGNTVPVQVQAHAKVGKQKIGMTFAELSSAVRIHNGKVPHKSGQPKESKPRQPDVRVHTQSATYMKERYDDLLAADMAAGRKDRKARLLTLFADTLRLAENDERRLNNTFLLRTAFNSDEVKKALASCVDKRGVDEFRKLGRKLSNVAPGDELAGDVVCELKVADSGHGVDVIKLLRSRQVLMPAHRFSASALARKKDKWIARARCDECVDASERCDECRKRRLAGGMVMACAGLGVCDCKKDAPVAVRALDEIWVVQHKYLVWRQKRCEAAPEKEEHDCHRDRNAVFSFALDMRVAKQFGGRVDAHCRAFADYATTVAVPEWPNKRQSF